MRRIAFASGVAAALFTGVSAQAVRLAHSSEETLESELHTAAWALQK